MANLFNVAAFFIMFREALEAAVIVSIMLQLCTRLKLTNMKRWVWLGAVSGVAASVVIGVMFILLFYVAQNQLLSGDGKTVFEGFLFLTASYIITLLGFAMLRFRGYERVWAEKLETAAASKLAHRTASAVFLLAFSTTLREGVESLVFMAGVTAGTSVTSIIIPSLVGILVGSLVGIALYYTGKAISDIAWFMFIMCAILFFVAAGLTVRGVVSFEKVGWFGFYGSPNSARPWATRQLWDWSACCSVNVDKNKFFGVISSLFGYTDRGTAIWLFAYFGYWLEVSFVLAVKVARGVLTDAERKHRRKTGAAPGVMSMVSPTKGGDLKLAGATVADQVVEIGKMPSDDLSPVVSCRHKADGSCCEGCAKGKGPRMCQDAETDAKADGLPALTN